MRNLDFTSNSPQSIKLGDSNDVLSLQVTESDKPVDLSKVSSIMVKIGNALGFLTEINVDVLSLLHPTDGIIDVVISSKTSSELPAGQYLLEVWIDDAQGNTVIYPDTSYPTVIGFSIKKNIMTETSTVISTLTLADFKTKFDEMQEDLQYKAASGYFKGLKGDKGDKGDTGPAGSTGSQGIQGPAGPKGDKGDVGATGPQGLKGDKGDKGDTGTVDNAGLINSQAFKSLQTQVNNSAVGTNLLINSSSSSSSSTNGQTTIQGASPNINGVYSRTDSYEQVIAPSSSEFYYRPMSPIPSNLYGLTPGETYTLSGSVSHTAGTLKFRAQYGVNGTDWIWDNTATPIDLGIPVSDGSVFTPFSCSFTIPVGSTGLYFGLQNYDFVSGSLIRFKNMKLEKGSVATDWCPNPSEILTKSDYAKIQAAIVALGGALS